MEKSYFERGHWFGLCTGLVTFVSLWIYCIVHYGFLLGVGLGWLPSLIVAVPTYFLAALLWGPIALIFGVGLLLGIIQVMNGGGHQKMNSFADRMDAILAGKEEPQEKPATVDPEVKD